MDINDAFRRVVLRHAWLIALCTLIPALAVFVLTPKDSLYSSEVRVAVAAQAPRSSQEAAALAAQIEAVATSRSLVARAVQAAHLKRDPTDVAANHLDVSPLGTSAVMGLTLTDGSPSQVVALTQSVANQLAAALAQPIAQLTQNAKALEQQINDVQSARAKFVAAGAPVGDPRFPAQVADLDRQLKLLGDRLTAMNAQIDSMFTPTIIDGASPAQKVPSSRLPNAILAGLLGLLLGLGLAAALESMRPTVVGIDGLSRLFGAPALGTVDDRDGPRRQVSEEALAVRVQMAAQRVNADVVVVTGLGPYSQLRRIARDMDTILAVPTMRGEPTAAPKGLVETRLWSTGPATAESGAPAGRGQTRLAEATTLFAGSRGPRNGNASPANGGIRVLLGDEMTLSILSGGTRKAGLLIVAPKLVHRDELLEVADFAETTGWPVLGVISLAPSRRWRRRLQWPVAPSEGELS